MKRTLFPPAQGGIVLEPAVFRGRALIAATCLLVASGCAVTRFYDERGRELPGLPFVWKDSAGRPHLAYAEASTGLGEASFTVERSERGGYTRFSSNLDSSAGTQLAGDAIEWAFEAGKLAARAELRSRVEQMPDGREKRALLKDLGEVAPK